MHRANQSEPLPIDYETGYRCDTNRFSVRLERVTPKMGLLLNNIQYEPQRGTLVFSICLQPSVILVSFRWETTICTGNYRNLFNNKAFAARPKTNAILINWNRWPKVQTHHIKNHRLISNDARVCG